MTATDNRIAHEEIAPRLLEWYDSHARALPWRIPPGGERPDPYRTWLSEVMLQQTTVAAVKPYFKKFTRVWPDVDALAAASDADIMAAWAGLGYYSRARNLVACARQVSAMGGFPETETELRRLPGVGDYTAAAIAAIAFRQRAVVVDANVERVVARLFAIGEPLPGARKAIRSATHTITPSHQSGDFAQAMMDLGATICTPRDPRCLLCPLADACKARASGEATRYPVKPAKKSVPERRGTAFWIEREGPGSLRQVWLVERSAAVMLGGMRALPDDGWTARADGSGEPPVSADWEKAGAVRHGFTHAKLTLDLLRTKLNEASAVSGKGEWWDVDALEDAGLPTLFAKAALLALAADDDET
ncbi:A/G-specific adenine glycosylase [Altererythrobacter aurantiacus]|uniref:Adenine DNA glycosylase n=1 Tax=Parapontixanthobacter aurantiacus TaxID=1463599 RepID=A0A844ZEK1_9SPHN|nr:A/G-specific adenine glycosylase [Parapontixanthobacter aurantiacus]